MPVSMNAVAIDGEPLDGSCYRMQARIGVHILIVSRAEKIEYDSHFRDICAAQSFQLLGLPRDIFRQITIKEHGQLDTSLASHGQREGAERLLTHC